MTEINDTSVPRRYYTLPVHVECQNTFLNFYQLKRKGIRKSMSDSALFPALSARLCGKRWSSWSSSQSEFGRPRYESDGELTRSSNEEINQLVIETKFQQSFEGKNDLGKEYDMRFGRSEPPSSRTKDRPSSSSMFDTDADAPPSHTNLGTAVFNETKSDVTLILRNIPRACTLRNLLFRLDKTFMGEYDFVYLPFCFQSRVNKGYAFVNITSEEAAERFIQSWDKKIFKMMSQRVPLHIHKARLQGRDQHLLQLRRSRHMSRITNIKYQPAIFDDGVRVDYGEFMRILALRYPPENVPENVPEEIEIEEEEEEGEDVVDDNATRNRPKQTKTNPK